MLSFLIQAAAVSLSGVMSPGPMTAAALALGARRRHAGVLLAVGHAVVELPLMILIVAVMAVADVLQKPAARIAIGLAGGAALAAMGVMLLLSARKAGAGPDDQPPRSGALATGILLTGANPYFLVWWATVGMALTQQAVSIGAAAFAVFAVIHWLLDLAWLEALSVASFHGTSLLGPRSRRIIPLPCGIITLVIGGQFLWDAARTWISL